jgi:hypothetical protein
LIPQNSTCSGSPAAGSTSGIVRSRRVHVQLHALNSRQVRVLPAYEDT